MSNGKYLIVDEDTITISDKITDGIKDMVNVGVANVIDMDDKKILIGDKWDDIDTYEEWSEL